MMLEIICLSESGQASKGLALLSAHRAKNEEQDRGAAEAAHHRESEVDAVRCICKEPR